MEYFIKRILLKNFTMKTLNILLACLLSVNAFSQDLNEKKISSEVNEVTVFLDGAQVTRQKTMDLGKGKYLLKFTNLSPFIDAKSVQVKAEGNISVLAVNHQQNYLDQMQKSEEMELLEKQIDELDQKIRLEQTYMEIIREEINFLQENRDIGGRNEQVSITNLQQAADFYGKRLTSLKMDEIERNKKVRDLNEERARLQNQLNSLAGKKDYPSGEILVKVDARTAGSFTFALSYLVKNAGWFPSYDIRVDDISKPVQLIYKANVRQDTKVDWKNVKRTFSSSEPNVSGVAPKLIPYYLNYNMRPPTYDLSSNVVSGRIISSRGEAVPGANIVVPGTTIGTVTDMAGNYSITIPPGTQQLAFSSIGFETKTMPISGTNMNVMLDETTSNLNEVVMTGYGSTRKTSRSLQSAAPMAVEDDVVMIRGTSSIPVSTEQTQKQTTVEFSIENPYTIQSDNKNYAVDMEIMSLPAFYQYYCVPKIDKDAFLIANITNWEQYNLLAGETNIFFEGTYIGKSLLDVRFASDTLEISLGRDKNVVVKREKVKDFTTKQFIGNKNEETRAWDISVKNNKNVPIDMILLDQVPVSTLEEIEVDVQKVSGGRQNRETGEVKWQLSLQPSEMEELELRYSVKYPKNKVLIIE